MKHLRHSLWLALLLAGCAKLTSTLPPPGAPASYVGAQPGVLAVEALEPQLTALQDELAGRIAGHSWPVPVQLSRAGEVIRLRLGADESFGAGSAQLRPAALGLYAEFAGILNAQPGLVAHVVVHGAETAEDLSTDLSARRAAAVQSYLQFCGVPGTRLRAEGRGAQQPLTPDGAVPRIELVLQPIVAGREAQAWVPPA